MHRLIFQTTVLLFTCLTGISQQVHSFTIKDLTPELLKFLSDTTTNQTEERKQLENLVNGFDKDFYREVINFKPDDSSNTIRYINKAKTLKKEIAFLNNHFKEHFNKSVNLIAKYFPSIRTYTNEVYIVPTMFQTNGQIRYWRNKWILIYGMDAQAAEKDYAKELNAIIIHEMLHLVNARQNDSISILVGKFYQNPFSVKLAFFYHLYIEGLAVYMTKKVDRKISLDVSLMRKELTSESKKKLPELLIKAKALMNSTNLQDVQNFFWMNGSDSSIPKKSGYYIGYLLIKDIAKRMSVEKLFSLYGDELEKELSISFATISTKNRYK